MGTAPSYNIKSCFPISGRYVCESEVLKIIPNCPNKQIDAAIVPIWL